MGWMVEGNDDDDDLVFLFKSTFLFSSRKFKYDWFAPVDEREIVHDTISTWYRASSNGTLAIARLGHSKKCSSLFSLLVRM